MANQLRAALLVPCRNQLGEGPVWNPAEQALYWVDIRAPAIFRRGPGGDVTQWQPPFRVCALAPMAQGGFIASTEHGFAVIDPVQDHYQLIGNPEQDRPGNRFNDGKVDRWGRFWAGTMDDTEQAADGALYRLDPDLHWTMMDQGYGIPNGPAFAPVDRRMYHTDSARRIIYTFDVTAEGVLSRKQVFAQFDPSHGYPDGMTVDRQGNLWVAFWDGWCLRCLSPAGALLQHLPLPVARPTSCAFGGPDLETLYVTSARHGLDENQLQMQPLAGGVFTVTPDIGGVEHNAFAGAAPNPE